MSDWTDRFWSHVDRKTADECWPWIGSRNSKQYGLFWTGERFKMGHRLSYELEVGPIPEGRMVCHSCDNPPCCNPNHLWIGDASSNRLDAMSKGRIRLLLGDLCPFSRLSTPEVMEIRELHAKGETPKRLAEFFGVTSDSIRDVVYRRTWRHLP